MDIKSYWSKLKNLPDSEALYFFFGKTLAAIGIGILIVNWFDINSFMGWILLAIGIALATPPGLKIFDFNSPKIKKSKRRT